MVATSCPAASRTSKAMAPQTRTGIGAKVMGGASVGEKTAKRATAKVAVWAHRIQGALRSRPGRRWAKVGAALSSRAPNSRTERQCWAPIWTARSPEATMPSPGRMRVSTAVAMTPAATAARVRWARSGSVTSLGRSRPSRVTTAAATTAWSTWDPAMAVDSATGMELTRHTTVVSTKTTGTRIGHRRAGERASSAALSPTLDHQVVSTTLFPRRPSSPASMKVTIARISRVSPIPGSRGGAGALTVPLWFTSTLPVGRWAIPGDDGLDRSGEFRLSRWPGR